jgi:hypothetical protein
MIEGLGWPQMSTGSRTPPALSTLTFPFNPPQRRKGCLRPKCHLTRFSRRRGMNHERGGKTSTVQQQIPKAAMRQTS